MIHLHNSNNNNRLPRKRRRHSFWSRRFVRVRADAGRLNNNNKGLRHFFVVTKFHSPYTDITYSLELPRALKEFSFSKFCYLNPYNLAHKYTDTYLCLYLSLFHISHHIHQISIFFSSNSAHLNSLSYATNPISVAQAI